MRTNKWNALLVDFMPLLPPQPPSPPLALRVPGGPGLGPVDILSTRVAIEIRGLVCEIKLVHVLANSIDEWSPCPALLVFKESLLGAVGGTRW